MGPICGDCTDQRGKFWRNIGALGFRGQVWVCFSLENRDGGIHISKFTQGIVSCNGARTTKVSLVIVPHYRRSSCKTLVLPVCGEILQKSFVCSHPHPRGSRTASEA